MTCGVREVNLTNYYFDMSITQNRWAIRATDLTRGTFVAEETNGSSWSSGSMRVVRSNDGSRWFPLSSSVTLTASGATAEFDIDMAWIAIEVATPQSGVRVNLAFRGIKES